MINQGTIAHVRELFPELRSISCGLIQFAYKGFVVGGEKMDTWEKTFFHPTDTAHSKKKVIAISEGDKEGRIDVFFGW